MGSRFQSGITGHWKDASMGDRRRSCRYTALHPLSELGWWKDSVFVHQPAELIDISTHGGLLNSQKKPDIAVGSPIWYRPIGINSEEWIEAVLISTIKPWLGKWKLTINFSTSFRYELFKAIVYGVTPASPHVDRDIPEHEMQHFWK